MKWNGGKECGDRKQGPNLDKMHREGARKEVKPGFEGGGNDEGSESNHISIYSASRDNRICVDEFHMGCEYTDHDSYS